MNCRLFALRQRHASQRKNFRRIEQDQPAAGCFWRDQGQFGAAQDRDFGTLRSHLGDRRRQVVSAAAFRKARLYPGFAIDRFHHALLHRPVGQDGGQVRGLQDLLVDAGLDRPQRRQEADPAHARMDPADVSDSMLMMGMPRYR